MAEGEWKRRDHATAHHLYLWIRDVAPPPADAIEAIESLADAHADEVLREVRKAVALATMYDGQQMEQDLEIITAAIKKREEPTA